VITSPFVEHLHSSLTDNRLCLIHSGRGSRGRAIGEMNVGIFAGADGKFG
jgi:hypothetical protein